jgi:ElaB/YqjD/DUF883 family membrane-anchored ribosome-binding protein
MTVETPRMTTTNDKAADAANGAESQLADVAKRAEAIVRDSVETLKAQTRAYADTAAQRLDTAQRVVVEHVREKPVQSTVTALGVGVVIGLLLARRH